METGTVNDGGRITSLRGRVFDTVVVGAGAVGCATARELAGRGFETLLVDRADIGSGTSSRSSRMLYSGVGYLAPSFPLWQIPFRPIAVLKCFLYARNIMHCRAELLKDMPGRLTKHRFHYPFRKGDRYPHWLVEFGFRMMEALCSRGFPLAFRRLPTATASRESDLAASLGGPLSSVGVFEEYMYDWPERICVDTALDAEARGATILTYAKVAAIRETGGNWEIALQDQAPGSSAEVRVLARTIVNAAGPWVDRVSGARSGDTKRVIGKKGVNVMVRLPDAWKGQGLEAFSSKGETFYVFPWGDHHFIGPTELVVEDDPDDVRVLGSEIDYILNEANLLFPNLHLTRNDVLHAWCGVRPMSTLDGETVSLPVRAFEDAELPGLITVTGSYIMMHRHAGRLAAQCVENKLGRRGEPPRGILPRGVDKDIAAIVRNEHVVRLVDLIRRRLKDGLDPSLGRSRAEEISVIAAEAAGWSEERRLLELRHFEEDTLRVYHQVRSLEEGVPGRSSSTPTVMQSDSERVRL
ncbi:MULTISPECIES: FAD-dependent oxidoreductase [Rhizobium/Agrobacterium group]|uniref:FAD-dependent oxidoreductase n=1 Tax=Rhizobium/Agrobacterium group TaxID=227290 RepID=UPI001ADD5361|nr:MULTISPECIES: FAD-dependent oxidoreductase [Rhizobium/Agrobacterium group]MBO9112698.1 FAD-dependent oxidoreductase [Agrobacterium sp. S2/73]QXZ76187.1 FAD-dependent oxidoreductase [Agrobacterium sp. S7/73]QYA17264.1 FAD-dependent oxidoreductase [Rhizobium sp. AB2/73]UEQ85619.1 FAD-dependent oxidoreductase [Rhizobium sp. AB2/73]